MLKKYLQKLWLPDYLSIFRIFAAIALVFIALEGWREVFSWLLLIGLITDALDGYIARKNNHSTTHGAKLDSAGDAMLFLAAATGIFMFEKAFFKDNITFIAVAFGFYFLQLGIAYWKYGQSSSFHTYAAKTAAVIQGIFLVATSFFEVWEWLFYFAIAISILETVEEIILIFIFEKPVYNVKGLYWVKKKGKDHFEQKDS